MSGKYGDQDGSRLDGLARNELCQLLTVRCNDITKDGGGGINHTCTHTPQIRAVVEILNALCRVGQFGDTIEAIKIEWK